MGSSVDETTRVIRRVLLGKRLRYIRIARDLSQQEVVQCSRAYSDPRILRAIEAGQFLPSRSRLARLLRYGLKIEDEVLLNEVLLMAGYIGASGSEVIGLGLRTCLKAQGDS
jgi:transcriptional regulator with XRE-family HTH domain